MGWFVNSILASSLLRIPALKFPPPLGGYESRLKIGIELGNLTGKSRKTTFNDGISISFACTVYIDYVSSHLRIYKNVCFKEFQICRFRTSRIYSTGSALESEWAKKPGVVTRL